MMEMMPDIIILSAASVILLISAFAKRFAKFLAPLLSCAAVIIAAILFGFSDIFNLLICLTSLIAFLYFTYIEYFIFGLFSVLGMLILVAAHSLLTLFLGIELIALPLYTLAAMQRKSVVCSEAAIKFFILGLLATGIFLYGISLLYGATNTLVISTITHSNLMQSFGLVFIIVGVAFKLGLVPFHMWVPDVYENSPKEIVLFLGTVPKIAFLVLALRLLTDIQDVLVILAILSIAIGNIVAIAQKDIKRMLGYAAIAQMGYAILGFLAGSNYGYISALFYILVYNIAFLGAFGLLILLEDLRGLNNRNPWLAFLMLIFMFSMAGVPPFVGFTAKLTVLSALIKAHLVWLAVFGVIFSVIGAVYYIRIVKIMYFDSTDHQPVLAQNIRYHLLITICGLAVIILGLMPQFLLHICKLAF